MSVFFHVGDNFISSEDSSPIGYTESGLTYLIIVQFEKFKNWHTQDFNTAPKNVAITSRDVMRDDVMHDDIITATITLQSLILTLVAMQFLWAYLKNRVIDFAHFLACEFIWQSRQHM